MRITRELLQRIAEDTVEKQAEADPTIIAAYLHGSVLDGEEEPVFGGTADIDLVLIHEDYDRQREIIRMTEDIHLDIEHHNKALYQPPKELRQRPWMGYTVFGCKAIYDPDHFIDFTQAGVRALFFHYENVLARAETLMNRARATWLHFHNRPTDFGPDQVMTYLQALADAANAVALLFGPPMGGRRFLLQYRDLADAVGEPVLYHDFIRLLAGEAVRVGQENVEELKEWMLQWEADFKILNQSYTVLPELHSHRHAYFMRAYESMLGSPQPETALYPLLHTWTLMAQTMPSQAAAWQLACEQLGLTGPEFESRLDGLDEFLDRVEVFVEEWEPQEGI